MTKFPSLEDVGYRRIAGELKRWVRPNVQIPALSTNQTGWKSPSSLLIYTYTVRDTPSDHLQKGVHES
jgi:hypothetical protein